MPRDTSSKEYKAKRRAISRRHQVKNYDKIYARAAARSLPKKPCEVCRSEQSEAHHDDYKKPWTVRWFCKEHHEEVDTELEREKASQHQGNKADKEGEDSRPS